MTLVLENITKDTESGRHIDGVSMQLAPGEMNVLLGRTLSGKTTLMRQMAGLEKPTSGRIFAGGTDVTGVAVQKRNVAMVYQQFINYPSMTVFDNIASPLKLARLSKDEIDRRVREAAELMRIDALLDRLPVELSGGQQQRTAMARALVKDCSLLLLDEPLVNLDYKLREELRAELPNLLGDRNMIVVYATTEPMEALLLGGQTAVLHEGRLLQHGRALDVYHSPASVEVGTIFSDPPINLMQASLKAGELHLANGARFTAPSHLAALPQGELIIGVRANHLNVARCSDQDVEVHAHVELAEITGSETFVHLDMDCRDHEGRRVEWVIQEPGVHDPDLGTDMAFYLDPARLYAFDADGALIAASFDHSAAA